MDFSQPLARGRLVSRYKRFFADVVLDDGREVTAHAANPGAMLGLSDPGAVVWVSPAPAAKRKLAWTLELVEARGGTPVLVNTHRPNALTAEAIAAGCIPELAGYASLRREVGYGDCRRVDLLLEHPDRPPCYVEVKTPPAHLQPANRCWVEVKSVTMSREAGLAEWPDCVSTRSCRQLEALSALVEGGDRSVLLFVVQRADCDRVAVAADLDPMFATALLSATRGGVEVLCYGSVVSPLGVRITDKLPMEQL